MFIGLRDKAYTVNNNVCVKQGTLTCPSGTQKSGGNCYKCSSGTVLSNNKCKTKPDGRMLVPISVTPATCT